MPERAINMKIVFLARKFYPEIGGVEKHVLEISKRLVKQGHKVSVITELEKNTNNPNYHSDSKSARLVGKTEGIEIFRINPGTDNWFKKFRIWKGMWQHRNLLNDADVIHCHDVFFWYLPFRFLYPTKKVYTTFHGYEGNSIPNRKAIAMHKLAEKLSKGNICVGDFFRKWYGTKPTFVTYGALNDNAKENTIKIPKKNSAIFLGRLEEETGIREYLKALSILRENGINLDLDVYGDGSLMTESKKYSKDHNLKLNFKGFVANASDFVKDYEYVFCSRYLGMLEAMISLRPVFAEYNNAIKKDYLEMAPFAKYISISKDGAAIARAVSSYIEKKNLEVPRAYLWVKNESWEKMVNLYLRLSE